MTISLYTIPLIDEQFGFRARHSCVHQVHRMVEHIQAMWTRGGKSVPTGVVFLDVAKAFDKVWHDGLIFKLSSANVPLRLVGLLRDFLSNRSFAYKVEGTL